MKDYWVHIDDRFSTTMKVSAEDRNSASKKALKKYLDTFPSPTKLGSSFRDVELSVSKDDK